MKRSTWITLVDAVAFISFVLLIGTGFLIRYGLPPGSGSLEGGGAGWRAAARPISLIWGMTRHEWGTIHFWLSVTFLAIMAFHLFIHWRWIVVSFKGKDPDASRINGIIGIAAIVGLIALALAPFLSPKKEVPRGELKAMREAPAQPEKQNQ